MVINKGSVPRAGPTVTRPSARHARSAVGPARPRCGQPSTPAMRSVRNCRRRRRPGDEALLLAATEFDVLVLLVLDGLDDFEGHVPERPTDFALCDALGVLLAVGVEDLHLQQKS